MEQLCNKNINKTYASSGDERVNEGFVPKDYTIGGIHFHVTGEFVDTKRNMLKKLIDILSEESEVMDHASTIRLATSE